MDGIILDEAFNASLGQWLSFRSRCFGDKGDVEDITEGLIHLVSLTSEMQDS